MNFTLFHLVPCSGVNLDSLRNELELLASLPSRLQQLSSDIASLFAKSKEHDAALGRSTERYQSLQMQLEDLQRTVSSLQSDRQSQAGSGGVTKSYVDEHDLDLLRQLKELERAINSALQRELKRIERELSASLHAHMSGNGAPQSETSAARIHFRCLSCNSVTDVQNGAGTNLYQKATGLHPGATAMMVERGNELFIMSRDGDVYRGREPDTVILAEGDRSRQRHHHVAYSDRPKTHAGSRTINSWETPSIISPLSSPLAATTVSSPTSASGASSIPATSRRASSAASTRPSSAASVARPQTAKFELAAQPQDF